MAKLILLLGGARSGKSTAAENMAAAYGQPVLFVATAEAWDDDMRARIGNHQASRPADWRTLEAPRGLAESLRAAHSEDPLPPVIVLDCITLLASNILLGLPEDCTQEAANTAITTEIDALLGFIAPSDSTWLLVSNEVGMGIVPPYRLGRLYRDALGRANQRLAQAAHEVILLVAGLPWRLK
jgi:adenosylcobinamide kinase / adenosylcobinamide-phosphate guanylyltransferase